MPLAGSRPDCRAWRGAVQVVPLAADLDVGFVNADRAAMGSAELAQPFLDRRRVGKDPSADRALVHFEAAISEHLLQAAIAVGTIK